MKKRRTSIHSFFGILLVIASVCPDLARADESYFGYVYTADLLPQGKWEYEQVNTLRSGKARGDYAAFDLRNEFEYGVTDDFSASFYLNSSYLSQSGVYDPEDTTQNMKDQSDFNLNGVSVELKYRLMSPYSDPFGLLVYLEPEISTRDANTGENLIERALEFKLVLQKNFFNDRLVTALNLTAEPEWEIVDGTDIRRELNTEVSAGASYRVIEHWNAGIEFKNSRHFMEASFDHPFYSAFFLGPNVHYANGNWWATLTVLPQIAGNPNVLGPDANGQMISDSYRTLGNASKSEVRLKFGYNF